MCPIYHRAWRWVLDFRMAGGLLGMYCSWHELSPSPPPSNVPVICDSGWDGKEGSIAHQVLLSLPSSVCIPVLSKGISMTLPSEEAPGSGWWMRLSWVSESWWRKGWIGEDLKVGKKSKTAKSSEIIAAACYSSAAMHSSTRRASHSAQDWSWLCWH